MLAGHWLPDRHGLAHWALPRARFALCGRRVFEWLFRSVDGLPRCPKCAVHVQVKGVA